MPPVVTFKIETAREHEKAQRRKRYRRAGIAAALLICIAAPSPEALAGIDCTHTVLC